MNYNNPCCSGAEKNSSCHGSASEGFSVIRENGQNCPCQGNSWQRRNFAPWEGNSRRRGGECPCGESGIRPAISPRCTCPGFLTAEARNAVSSPCKNAVEKREGACCGCKNAAETRTTSSCECTHSERSLAMVYAPHQCFTELYDPRQGLCNGTVFSELNKPFLAYGRRSR